MNMVSGRDMGGLGNMMTRGMGHNVDPLGGLLGHGSSRGMGTIGDMMNYGMSNMMGHNNRGMNNMMDMGRRMVSPSQNNCDIFWINIYINQLYLEIFLIIL